MMQVFRPGLNVPFYPFSRIVLNQADELLVVVCFRSLEYDLLTTNHDFRQNARLVNVHPTS